MKKIKLFLVTALLFSAATTVFAQNSGTTGPLTWVYTSADSTLTISGIGDMPDYTNFNTSPFYFLHDTCRHINIENGVTSIGNYAFYNFNGVQEVTIPNTVTKIGEASFNSWEVLTEITIPDAVTTIGDYAFQYCDALTEVNIGSGVVTIGNFAFAVCGVLESINVAAGNLNYSSENGVLFNKDKTTLLIYPGGKLDATYVVPNSVTTLSDAAFANNFSLTSVTLSNLLTAIPDELFNGSISLTSITIPNSVTSIGFAAFMNCTSLQDLIIGSSVTSIGTASFFQCTGLETVTNHAATPQLITYAADVFMNTVVPSCTLYVPAASVALYEAADVWKDFGTIEAIVTVVPVTGVTLNETELSLNVDETATLIATVMPANATNQAITFSSSDNLIATVSITGLVTAIDEGVATITVTTMDGEFTATCEVTVTNENIIVPVTGVTLNETELSLNVDETATLIATVMPANATNQTVTFSSSDNLIATVSTTGLVTAIDEGVATITVTTVDGEFTATCEVTVTGESGITDLSSFDFNLYPNPVQNELNIESGELNIEKIEIVDLSGKTVSTFNNTENKINVSTLSAGIYFIKINTDKGVVAEKFVKE